MWAILFLNLAYFIYVYDIPQGSIVSYVSDFPVPVQFVLFGLATHVFSYLGHALLVVFLWRKYRCFNWALIIGLNEIALTEFSYIIPQRIQWQVFLGTWYIRFVLAFIPLLIFYKTVRVDWKKFLIVYGIALVFVYVPHVLNWRDAFTWLPGDSPWPPQRFVFHPELYYTWEAWATNISFRLHKILMLIAYATSIVYVNNQKIRSVAVTRFLQIFFFLMTLINYQVLGVLW